ncbi:MAG: DUF349 domain-containing protein, partial [Abitibacteriaceae bacterium]|nr:DUF349 domain-containing protein [Abditibacteriaceae bacterium]
YVDDQGNVCQRDGLFKGRIVGQMRGHNKEAALAFFVLRFRELEDRFEALERDVHAAENKAQFLGKVRRMLDYVPQANALGDFDRLVGRLHTLEREITDWMADNQRRKERLISQAQSWSASTEWKRGGEALKQLQAEWKHIGSAGREADDALWQDFREAQDEFFQRRTQFFEQRDREQQANLDRKEELIAEASSLAYASDYRAAIEHVKTLQAQWKRIGPVPRDRVELLWDRFREACDTVFDNARQERERHQAERERKQAEWRERMRGVIAHKQSIVDRLEESIEHDEGLVAHWQEVIDNLHDGARADEIRDSMEEKISCVEGKMESKRERIAELEASIREIEDKLNE